MLRLVILKTNPKDKKPNPRTTRETADRPNNRH